ncbi:MAG: Holliday junction branch migration protein RuvA [Candidatus Marinimicrobia bacterium]|nr:Holliday junction branch migration protein RuvA [Candidatus Neomarinimicrobiota bacterium]
MFAYLKGLVDYKDPTLVVLDVNGVGYQINIPLSTYEVLPLKSKLVKLLIYYHVREDTQSLFGFATKEEKDLFLMLINISGIGPKMALTILSGATPAQFKNRIISGDVKALTFIPGIGMKTAKRIIVELREKFVGMDEELPEEITSGAVSKIGDEALRALLALGYRRGESLDAVKKAYKELGSEALIEKFIKVALSKM